LHFFVVPVTKFSKLLLQANKSAEDSGRFLPDKFCFSEALSRKFVVQTIITYDLC